MKGLKKYKEELEQRKIELETALRNREDIAIEQAPDELDATQLAAIREQAINDLDRESRLLQEVKAALARIQDGEYGICENCEEEIANKRLDAIPWARYCIRCQDEMDREGYAQAA